MTSPGFDIALRAAADVEVHEARTDKIQVLRQRDIDRCPKRSLLPAHYHNNTGDCRCDEKEKAMEALQLLKKAEAAVRRKRQRAQRWLEAC